MLADPSSENSVRRIARAWVQACRVDLVDVTATGDNIPVFVRADIGIEIRFVLDDGTAGTLQCSLPAPERASLEAVFDALAEKLTRAQFIPNAPAGERE